MQLADYQLRNVFQAMHDCRETRSILTHTVIPEALAKNAFLVTPSSESLFLD